jgi:hypothetical protein
MYYGTEYCHKNNVVYNEFKNTNSTASVGVAESIFSSDHTGVNTGICHEMAVSVCGNAAGC